ncbi:hypothetical protein TWF718_001519 [Orbilia javanica]|uniref:Uncharacterized protein n=1 Tax=Orbilia javanica TaxID=47235 RepID=A0AAN8RHD0_9PEZI
MTENTNQEDTVAGTAENIDPPPYTPLEKAISHSSSSNKKTDDLNSGNKTESNPAKGLKINRNDPPQPGSVYIISESNTSKVITNQGGRIVLTEYDGEPKKSQKWVCHRSGGWLGFTSDAGPETKYLGHDFGGTLVCTATCHLAWEHFNVLKREGDGFEFMVRHWFGSWPLGYIGENLGKRPTPSTWWGFTKVV